MLEADGEDGGLKEGMKKANRRNRGVGTTCIAILRGGLWIHDESKLQDNRAKFR
jgi:hypothetical protein